MDKISQLAVTNGNTMIPIQTLTANREHGILVTYIPPLKLFRGLQAKPLFDILQGRTTENYQYSWIHSAATVAHKLGFRTLHHLLLSNKLANTLRYSTKSRYQPEVRQAIIAIQAIGLKPVNPISNYEEAISQLFFHNPNIQSTAHNRPFKHEDYPHLSKQLYYIGQLLSDTNIYSVAPPHPRPQQPYLTRRQMEIKFRCTLTPLQYRDIINSIPPDLTRLMIRGNLPLIQDGIYRHREYGQVTYYQVIDPLTNIITPMDITPCGLEPNHDRRGIMGIHPYPQRHQLKLTSHTHCGCDEQCRSIQHPAELTPYDNTFNYYDNIRGLGLHYPPLPHCYNFKTITNHYRHKDSSIPPVLIAKQTHIADQEIATDPKLWLHIMQTIHDSFIDSKNMDMILKLLHDALYMGHIARQYQINIKHMDKYWPHLVIPEHCYHCPQQRSTYQHEFFECGIMPLMWQAINGILHDANLNLTLTSIAALPEFLYNAHNPEFNLRTIVNTNVVILTLKSVWDAYQGKQDMTPEQYRADIVRRVSMYLTNEIKLLPCHRDNAYKHGCIVLRGLRRRHFDQRQKMLLRNPALRTTTLSEMDITAYENIWLPTGMITIADDRKSMSIMVSPRLPA